MLQGIPEDVPRWVRKSRGVDGGVDLATKMESELNEWADRRLQIVEEDDDVDESEYMHWYLRITRRVVGRPISLSSEFQRTVGLNLTSYLTFLSHGILQINLTYLSFLTVTDFRFKRYCILSRYILRQRFGCSTI